MAIDTFLNEYRDYMFSKNTILDFINDATSPSDVYVILHASLNTLRELQTTMLFLDENLIDIEREVEELFENVYKKIDKIEEIAEGYQNLNTNELSYDDIKSFKAFNITKSSFYDEYFKALALPRRNKIRRLTTNFITRENINAKEVFVGFIDKDTHFIKVVLIDPEKSILKRVDLIGDKGQTLESIYDRSLIKVSREVVSVEVVTDNVEKNLNSFSYIDSLNDVYVDQASIALTEEVFEKKGSLFKINIDSEIPTQCEATLKITTQFKDRVSNKLKRESVYINLKNSREVILTKIESKPGATLKDIYGNSVSVQDLDSNDLVLGPEFSTDEVSIKHKGNKVFDISGMNTEEFSITASITLYSFIDQNQTPKIKGMYGYVTE